MAPNDSEGEEYYYTEEEEEYIVLDFNNKPNLSTQHYKLIDLDTATPFIQIDKCIYRGSYDQVLGTDIHLLDPNSSGEPKVLKGYKRLSFVEVEVREKKTEKEQEQEQEQQEMDMD